MHYRTEEGKTLIVDWYREQDPTLQAVFDTALNDLASTEDWSELEWFKALTGRHTGLHEIKIDISGEQVIVGKKPPVVHYRPVGFLREAQREFVLILGCTKSGRSSIPPNAFELALELKAEFEQGKGAIHAHSL